MAKTIKVIDLLKEASEGNNITFRDGGGTYKDSLWTFINMYMDERKSFDEIQELLNSEVVIIEEQQDIDIQEIDKLPDYNYSIKDNREKINELVQAVKQLDKNIKDKE